MIKFSFNKISSQNSKTNPSVTSLPENTKEKEKNNKTNNKNKNIPWDITPQILKAQKILNQMYLSLDINEKKFADKYLLPYITTIKGDTGVPIDIMNRGAVSPASSLVTLPVAKTGNLMEVERVRAGKFYVVEDLKTIEQISLNYKDLACIYSFSAASVVLSHLTTKEGGGLQPELSMKTSYIGQTQDIFSRLKAHYFTSKRIKRQNSFNLLYNYCTEVGGIKNLNFNIILTFPTFQSLYIKECGTLSPEFKFILQSFTEFKLGLYEQALISYLNPGLNTTKLINFTFFNWSFGKFKPATFVSFFETSKGYEIYKFVSARLTFPPVQLTKVSPKAKNEGGEVNKYKEKDRINTKFNNFDFTLYFKLCEFRNIEPLKISELEWLVGFMEKNCRGLTRYDTNCLMLSSKNVNFLLFLKNKLGLTVNPFLNSPKTAYLLQIANNLDSELIFSILYNNIITPQFLNIFNDFIIKFNFVKKKTSLSYINPSLKDAWLAGVIDAHASFSFDDFSPLIRISSHPDFDFFFKLLLPMANFRKKDIAYNGTKAMPFMEYITEYPLILQSDTFFWYSDYVNFWYQYRLDVESNITNSDLKRELLVERNKILSGIKLNRPTITMPSI